MSGRLDDGTGYQDVDTSLKAAREVSGSGRAATLRGLVLKAYHASIFGLTADECADLLGEDKLSIRPRVAELKLDGKLTDTGIRRKNASGKSAAVMKIAGAT